MTTVFIVSAPSGSGKSTLVNRVLDQDPRLLFSISYTTRQPRGHEKQDDHYHFIGRDEFERRLEQDEFLEWAKVFEKHPHFAIFPGDAIEVMPVLQIPQG